MPTEFDGQSIRRVYDEATDTWWFSVIDIVQVLTDSENARDYWFKMKQRAKAEPIKRWLAKVGYERMQEMADPAPSLARARQTWQQHGRSDKWIQQRMTGQETRYKLIDYWSEHDIKQGSEFAILTNIIHQVWAGLSVAQHQQMKGLSSHNLRDHMSEAELIFTALAELSTRQIAESVDATGMAENQSAAKTGGRIARRPASSWRSKPASPW